MKPAYYNECDPNAAQTLRNLIAAGLIAPGDVDERSIEDVAPDDLRGYTQHHFFAGIGIWSYALRLAGWPDDKPVWSGSCPCQPFSAAGKGAGFDDERHLWPAWYWLVSQCRPARIYGEQVASKIVEPWIDLVHADLEAVGYAFGCVPFPSAGIGAPHIRDRLYWMAYPHYARSQGWTGMRERSIERATWARSVVSRLADTECPRIRGRSAEIDCAQAGVRHWEHSHSSFPGCDVSRLADAYCEDQSRGRVLRSGEGTRESAGSACERSEGLREIGARQPGPTNGFWRDTDWLFCRDGKWRPVEPGTFPLAHGAPSRVGRLRGYGNALNAIAAAEFIAATYVSDAEWTGVLA